MNFFKSQLLRAKSRMRMNVLTLLFFEIIYKILGTYTIFPLDYQFIVRCLYHTEGTFHGVYFNQATNIVAIVILFLLTALYFLYEICVLVTGLGYARRAKPVGVLTLLGSSFKSLSQVLKPKNWVMILVVYAFLPVLHFGIRLGIMQQRYLLDTALNTIGIPEQALNIAILVVLALMIVIMVAFSFAIILYVECDINFITSVILSKEAFKGGVFKTIGRILWVMIKAIMIPLIGLIMVALIGLISYLIIGAFGLNIETIRVYVGLMSTLTVLYGLFSSVFTTFYFFLGVYELLYGSVEIPKRENSLSLRLLALVTLCIIYAIFQGSVISGGISDESLQNVKNGTLVTGHRGNMKIETDNTRASFESAISNGADFIELDVIETADGVLVISHDDSLVRQTGFDYKIPQTTYAQIQNLELKDNFRRTSPGQKIMTLEEVVSEFGNRTGLIIEIKDASQREDTNLASRVAEIVERYGVIDTSYISSTNLDYLKEIESLNPEFKTALITGSDSVDVDEVITDGVFFEEHSVDTNLVDRLHLRGKTVSAWPSENEAEIRRLLSLGVDNLVTNDVGLSNSLRIESAPNILEQIIELESLILRKA